jgi:D-glycero-alpha-D-manno-heptose-7-phosphate kinase
MTDIKKSILEADWVEASAPCRLDMGGTLDISTFQFPLRHFSPVTLNIAIDLRTTVKLLPYADGQVKVSSKGFESAVFPYGKAPFSHPLGLMFAIAAYFNASGIHISIDSSSPPRSALGGSSAAAVALITAFLGIPDLAGKTRRISPDDKQHIAKLAQALEQSVAGVPCGIQDQLAAVYGGVNAWYWTGSVQGSAHRKVMLDEKTYERLEKRLIVAYCGAPHESKDINGRWVEQFLAGRNRNQWLDVIDATQKFIAALFVADFRNAAMYLNRETAIRQRMTPDVLDDLGKRLVEAAVLDNCGARFAGAGGGGCLWALGKLADIGRLKAVWNQIIAQKETACLLDVKIDRKGVQYHTLR